MSNLAALGLFLTVLASAQACAEPSVTVEQLTTSPEAWDGEIVEASGWLLSSCDDYERTCALEAARNGEGDRIFFAPSDEDRIILRKLIGRKISVRGCYDGCLGPRETQNKDGSMTLHLCIRHLTDARLVTQTKDNF